MIPTLRKEHRHSLPKDIIETGDDEHLLGTNHFVLHDIREYREEQTYSGGKHYEGGQHATDVRRRSNLFYFLSENIDMN